MDLRLVQKSVTLNDLERIMAIILRYFAEFGITIFAGNHSPQRGR